MKKADNKIVVIILLVILLLAIGISMLLFFKNRKSEDFAPKLDSAAEQMEEESETKLEAPEGGGAVSLTYSTEVTISLKDRTAQVIFENPSRSTKDAAVQLLVDGQKEGQEALIAESELIPAGYKLSQMELTGNVDLKEGKYKGSMRVLFYDTETGAKESVDTRIPVTLTVNNGD